MATTDTTAPNDSEPLVKEHAFQRDLLYALAEIGPTHGLGIKNWLQQYYETELHHGRLYPNLDQLIDRGLVSKGEVDRRTNEYKLTRRGRSAVRADLSWRTDCADVMENGSGIHD